jgi:hypothetical protein
MFQLEIKKGLDAIVESFKGMPNTPETRELLQYNITSYLIFKEVYNAKINIWNKNNGDLQVDIK